MRVSTSSQVLLDFACQSKAAGIDNSQLGRVSHWSSVGQFVSGMVHTGKNGLGQWYATPSVDMGHGVKFVLCLSRLFASWTRRLLDRVSGPSCNLLSAHKPRYSRLELGSLAYPDSHRRGAPWKDTVAFKPDTRLTFASSPEVLGTLADSGRMFAPLLSCKCTT